MFAFLMHGAFPQLIYLLMKVQISFLIRGRQNINMKTYKGQTPPYKYQYDLRRHVTNKITPYTLGQVMLEGRANKTAIICSLESF